MRTQPARSSIPSRAADDRVALRQELDRVKAELALARQQALHDALTGLPNRLLFRERLEHGLRQGRRQSWMLAILFIDLDGFKRINDELGHPTGDEVLVAVGRCLQTAVRADDTVCRYGGDEFTCLLLNVHTSSDAERFATGLARRIATACETPANRQLVNASIGVALYPDHGHTADALIRHADQAMYRAKGTEHRVVLYEPERAD